MHARDLHYAACVGLFYSIALKQAEKEEEAAGVAATVKFAH